jgi:hypothetical protein
MKAAIDRIWAYEDRVTILRCTSQKAASWLGLFDMVYIDAEHSYEAVKKDIKLWLPHVKPGGFISGHDYGHKRFPGVKQAVDEAFPRRQLLRHGIWVKRL